MAIFGSRKAKNEELANGERASEATTLGNEDYYLDKSIVKRATRTRMIWCLITSFLLLISLIFLILVEIGNTYNTGALKDFWFIKLNLTNVIPASTPNAALLNSIARTLGLHDFYQVGLWNYCEGYNGEGVTDCTKPQTLFWFNPVAIITSQLLSGASIALPTNLTSILNIIETASKWMFGLFLTGTCLTFVMMFVVLLSVFSRWTAFLVMILSFLNALFVIAASVIATVMWVIMKDEFENDITAVNIGATLGTRMFAFMWIASACCLLAWLIQLCLCCCCASRRDVRKGKKRGSKKAYEKA